MELVNAMTMAGLPPTSLSLQDKPTVSHKGNKQFCPTVSPTSAPTISPTYVPTIVETMIPHREHLVKVHGKLQDVGNGGLRGTSGSSIGRYLDSTHGASSQSLKCVKACVAPRLEVHWIEGGQNDRKVANTDNK